MNRPTGVTILAVIAFIFGAFLILGGLGVMLGGAVLAKMASSGGLGMLAGVGGAILGIVLLGFAVVYVIDGIGLLKVKNWARILTIILVGLSLLRTAYGLLTSFTHFNVIAICFGLIFAAIDVWILVYLFKPDVKQAFGATSF
jgi:hypothetical protein